MSSLRVALVSPYALSVFGGVQEQVLAMSRELARRGHVVLIIAPDAADRAIYDTSAEVQRFGNLVSLPANGSRAPLSLSLVASRAAHRALSDFAPDVVHFHEPFAPLVGWAALRAHDACAVGTFHRSGAGPALRLTRPLLELLAKGLDATVAVSEAAAVTIRSAVHVEPRVLFNGFETERFVATPRERTSETTLVTVGRLEERKGTAHVINAVRTHNARQRDQWRLVIIGDGPQRGGLEALAAHDDMITFTGALDDRDKRAWLRRANALVAPATHGESFGLVLLEAMASETTVVASDIDGYRDAVGDNGVLFRAGDPAALEEAVVRALAHETPDALARARAYAEHWSMRALIDAYELVYARALELFASPQ